MWVRLLVAALPAAAIYCVPCLIVVLDQRRISPVLTVRRGEVVFAQDIVIGQPGSGIVLMCALSVGCSWNMLPLA